MWWAAAALLILVLAEVYWALWLLAWREVGAWVRLIPPIVVIGGGAAGLWSVIRARAAFEAAAGADPSRKSSLLSESLAHAHDPLIYGYALVLAAGLALGVALLRATKRSPTRQER
jgi:hypothetical protein